ncbi:hypothetical protein ACT16_06445 [Mycobacterium heckeshornense]|nr:hypothetical protein ACT16_06445 [Mycobacterium heckeshornense]
MAIPNIINQNAEIARKQLEQMGFTDIQLVSANPKYQIVLRAANWTVVSVDPPPGTAAATDSPVIVKVTKE